MAIDLNPTNPIRDIRTLPGSKLPQVGVYSGFIDAQQIARKTLLRLASAFVCGARNESLQNIFIQDALWKDILSFSGDLRTFFSEALISITLTKLADIKRPYNFVLASLPLMEPRLVKVTEQLSAVKAFFTFQTKNPAANHGGVMSIVYDVDARWKIWHMTTWLEDLKGFEARNPKTGVLVDPFLRADLASQRIPVMSNALKQMSIANDGNDAVKCEQAAPSREDNGDCPDLPASVDVLVVGAGHNGLGLAARLAGSDLSYIVVESNQEIGDNWQLRYDCARFHTPKHFGALPFFNIRSEHSEFLHKSELACMLREYASDFKLNVSTRTKIISCQRGEKDHLWYVRLKRPDLQNSHLVVAKHIVMCTGSGSQVPYIPDIPKRALFKGEAVHSAHWRNCSTWRGKDVVIVGTANTAHDVAEDALEHGAHSVTMIQRSPTYILPKEYLVEMYKPLYNDSTPPEVADRIAMTVPTALSNTLTSMLLHGMSATTSELPRYEALAKAGFRVIREGDLVSNILCRGGGHYIDVGASALISEGKIKIESGPIQSFTETGLELSDGFHINADAIVFATGFSDKDMVPIAGSILGPHNVVGCSPVWGLDSEGEVRGCWRKSGREGLWFMPGAGSSGRFWSRFLVTQLKADICGIDLRGCVV